MSEQFKVAPQVIKIKEESDDMTPRRVVASKYESMVRRCVTRSLRPTFFQLFTCTSRRKLIGGK